MKQDIHRALCQRDEMSVERDVFGKRLPVEDVHGAKCSVSNMSMGQNVQGVICSWDKMSMGKIVMGQDIYGARCQWGAMVTGKISMVQGIHRASMEQNVHRTRWSKMSMEWDAQGVNFHGEKYMRGKDVVGLGKMSAGWMSNGQILYAMPSRWHARGWDVHVASHTVSKCQWVRFVWGRVTTRQTVKGPGRIAMGYNARSGNASKARCPWIKMLKGPTVTNIYIQNVLVRLDEKSNSSVISAAVAWQLLVLLVV